MADSANPVAPALTTPSSATPIAVDVAGPPKTVTVEAPDKGPKARSLPVLQEGARQKLMLALVAILGIEILFAMTATWLPQVWGGTNMSLDNLKEIMTLIFGPTIALVGSATGFYFGIRSAD